MHCFEVRTADVDYLVGVDPLCSAAVALPPPDSGVGAYLARSWETAVRQALMPVTVAHAPHKGQCLAVRGAATSHENTFLWPVFSLVSLDVICGFPWRGAVSLYVINIQKYFHLGGSINR